MTEDQFLKAQALLEQRDLYRELLHKIEGLAANLERYPPTTEEEKPVVLLTFPGDNLQYPIPFEFVLLMQNSIMATVLFFEQKFENL